MSIRYTMSPRLRWIALAATLVAAFARPALAAPPQDDGAANSGQQAPYNRGDRNPGRFDDAGGNSRRDPLPWNQLDARQQAFLRSLKPNWDRLPPWRQQRIAMRVQRWTQLPPERQDQIRQNIARFAQMTPEQRREASKGERNFQAMAPADRERVVEARRRFMQSLTPDQRQALREKFRVEREARQRMRGQQPPQDAPGSR